MRPAIAAAVAIALLLVAMAPVRTGQAESWPQNAFRAPILIEGDSQFTGENGVTGGFGTPASPYVISNWTIGVSSGAAIEIRNTTAPFVLRDVEVLNPGPAPLMEPQAVRLENVASAAIEDFWFHEVSSGIVASNVSVLAIRSGAIRLVDTSDGRMAIWARGVGNLSINRVAFSGGVEGIVGLSAAHATVTSCSFDAIYTESVIFFDSLDVTVRENWFNKSYVGFAAVNSSETVVGSNRFEGGRVAVFFDASDNATVEGNDFLSPELGAIEFQGDLRYPERVLSDFLIYHNNFVNSSANLYGQLVFSAWDAGYPSGGNYWTAYQGHDVCRGPNQTDCSNRDGIGDTPFQKPEGIGPWTFLDSYPLIRPYPLPTAPPLAHLVAALARGEAGTSLAFNASASTDAVDPLRLLEFRWDWDGDGVWDTGWSGNATASHVFSVPGSYTVRMQVRNTAGLMDEALVTAIVDQPPWIILLPAGLVTTAAAAVGVAFVLRRKRGRMIERGPPPP